MSPTISELEKALAHLVTEHRGLLAAVEQQQIALKSFDLTRMNAAADAVEKARARVVMFENRRRHAVAMVCRTHRLPADVSLAAIAEADVSHKASLLSVRDELRSLAATVAEKNTVSAKVAGAMMGHLNTVVRLVSGAVRSAGGGYTKQGQHSVAARVGVMEAVA